MYTYCKYACIQQPRLKAVFPSLVGHPNRTILLVYFWPTPLRAVIMFTMWFSIFFFCLFSLTIFVFMSCLIDSLRVVSMSVFFFAPLYKSSNELWLFFQRLWSFALWHGHEQSKSTAGLDFLIFDKSIWFSSLFSFVFVRNTSASLFLRPLVKSTSETSDLDAWFVFCDLKSCLNDV